MIGAREHRAWAEHPSHLEGVRPKQTFSLGSRVRLVVEVAKKVPERGRAATVQEFECAATHGCQITPALSIMTALSQLHRSTHPRKASMQSLSSVAEMDRCRSRSADNNRAEESEHKQKAVANKSNGKYSKSAAHIR